MVVVVLNAATRYAGAGGEERSTGPTAGLPTREQDGRWQERGQVMVVSKQAKYVVGIYLAKADPTRAKEETNKAPSAPSFLPIDTMTSVCQERRL